MSDTKIVYPVVGFENIFPGLDDTEVFKFSQEQTNMSLNPINRLIDFLLRADDLLLTLDEDGVFCSNFVLHPISVWDTSPLKVAPLILSYRLEFGYTSTEEVLEYALDDQRLPIFMSSIDSSRTNEWQWDIQKIDSHTSMLDTCVWGFIDIVEPKADVLFRDAPF